MGILYLNPGYASMCKTYNAIQNTNTKLNPNFAGACIGINATVPVVALTDFPTGTKDLYIVGDWYQQMHTSSKYNYLYITIGNITAKIDINSYSVYDSKGNITNAVGNKAQYNHFNFEFHSSREQGKALFKWTEDNVIIYEGTIDWLEKGDDITSISLGGGDKVQLFCNIIISDEPIPINMTLVPLKITEIEKTMAKENDIYTATEEGQYLAASISNDTIDKGRYEAICLLADNAYYDGEELKNIKFDLLNHGEVVQSQSRELYAKKITTISSVGANMQCNIQTTDLKNYTVKYTAEK